MSAEQIDAEKLEEALTTLEGWVGESWEIMPDVHVIVKAARAHLATLPRVKDVEVWRVEYAYRCGGHYEPTVAQYSSHEMARNHAVNLGGAASCITVTGPHKQKVPA